ncbi:putative alpha-xylosidase [Nemania sp. FL0916]|nr:putative alpha-xylosidase [Nemania sp. FL0916]
MASEAAAASSDYIGYRLEAFIGVFTALEVIAVALRFWARSLSVARYDAGDYLIIAALIGQIGAGALAIASVKVAGVGHHVEYLLETDPVRVTNFFKFLVAISSWYASTESLAKIAVCFFYKQIFPQRSIRLTVHITIGVLIAASIAGLFADLFSCTPFEAHWGTAAEQAAHCIDTEALFVWGSFPNILTDIVLLVLPIPIVWKLNASIGLRIGLIITFLFGSIGLITSILRFVAFYNKSSFIDPTYSAVELIIWTVCEPGVYLIAACLLVYRPLIDKLGIPMITGTTRRGQSAGTGGLIRRGPGRSGVTDGSVGLRTIGGSGFRRLDNSQDDSLRKNTGITATTDVEVTFEDRPPPALGGKHTNYRDPYGV